MSKVCINCGTALEDNAIFCDECGTRQPDMQSAQQPFQQPVYGQAPSGNQQAKPAERMEGTLRNSGLVMCVISLFLLVFVTLILMTIS